MAGRSTFAVPVALGAFALGGCDKLLSLQTVSPGQADAQPADAVPDGMVDAGHVTNPDGPTIVCAGTLYFKTCASLAGMSGKAYVGNSQISTAVGSADCTKTQSQTGGPDVCVVLANSITISGTLEVIGGRPL